MTRTSIFTSRTTVDSFFKICEEARITVPETMKYICNTEAVALYLQKYTHEGQEFDLVLEGTLKFVYEDHTTYLNAGDSVYYNSGKPHGMIATSEGGCRFLAIVMKDGVQ